jgi:hypothetical protein
MNQRDLLAWFIPKTYQSDAVCKPFINHARWFPAAGQVAGRNSAFRGILRVILMARDAAAGAT